MSRAPRAVASHKRRKRVFKQAKGFYGRRKNNITSANAAVDRSMQHAYVGRKLRKRNFRALWIQRINAAVREHGLTYSRFISLLGRSRRWSARRPAPPDPNPPDRCGAFSPEWSGQGPCDIVLRDFND